MNRVRKFNPELFTILEIPEDEICRRQLSGYLLDYMTRRRLYSNDGSTATITLTPTLQHLTGLPYNRLILTKSHRKKIDWWEFVDLVVRRWAD